jgi:hypothetical protein
MEMVALSAPSLYYPHSAKREVIDKQIHIE